MLVFSPSLILLSHYSCNSLPISELETSAASRSLSTLHSSPIPQMLNLLITHLNLSSLSLPHPISSIFLCFSHHVLTFSLSNYLSVFVPFCCSLSTLPSHSSSSSNIHAHSSVQECNMSVVRIPIDRSTN
jgi:hypothetical protein